MILSYGASLLRPLHFWVFAQDLNRKMSSHDLHQSLSSMSQENTKQDFSHRFQSPESSTSLDTVRHTCNRDLSSRSISSLRSHISRPLRVTNANVCPSRTSSACTSHYPESSKNSISLRKVSKWECHRSSWGNDIPVPPQFRKSSALFLESGPLEDVDLDTEDTTNNLHQHKARNFKCDNAQNLIAERTQVETSLTNQPGAGLVRKKVLVKPSILVADTAAHKRHPFNKWMNTLRRRSSKRRGTLKLRQERWSLDDLGEGDFARSPAVGDEKENGHRKSSSWSSFGFVGVVRSATISLKSLSMPPQTQNPKRSLLLSNKNRTSNRSSWMFNAGHRGSIDSSQGSAQVIDEAAWERALQRRRTLEELISSEESYISDLKVLVNVASHNSHESKLVSG